jgi:glycosyltransferase involved in cell wall biosynthesis
MRILFLCNKSPWPPREGGPMAMNMLIEGLADAGHQVRVLAVNSHKYHISPADIPSRYSETTGIELIDVDLRLKPLAAFLNLFSRESFHVKRFISEKFGARLTGLLKTETFDIVQLETVFMCPYIGIIRKHSGAKIILRAHNIEHLIWQRIAGDTRNPLKKWYVGHLASTLKEYELAITSEVDGILAITSNDAEYFKSIYSHIPGSEYSRIPVADISFGINPADYAFPLKNAEFPSLFALGSMNWIPNQDGIRWFLRQVWPDVHRQFPELKFYLAGRGMPGWMRSLKQPNVIVLGEVADAREFMSSKAIMIVPLFSGSGIRVKIIEGMAARKTVISTRVGAEGIACTHLHDILIADSACEFFEMISLSVTDKALCERIGDHAATSVETNYSVKPLITKMVEFYEHIRR